VPAVAAALMATGQVRVSAWIAVDPVPADGSLEVMAGSHHPLFPVVWPAGPR
jgi:ectoine hydroxylase-related dioxygenase (phytanoyl-CoA dioxygenase family)